MNKHIFMYDSPSAKRSAAPGLINSEERSQPLLFSLPVSRRRTWLGNDFHIV